MGIFKDFGIFKMVTAKDKQDFVLGACIYGSASLEEKHQQIDTMITTIEKTDIPTTKKVTAINLAHRLKTANKESTSNLLAEINRLTGCSFK